MAVLDAPLADLLIGAEGGPPKKSRPSRESPGLVGFGGAVALIGGGLVPGVSVVLGLAGGVGASSPKRSTFGTARGGRTG